MGIFTKNYAKAGPGISKEEAAQRNYFDILFRHAFDFMKINMLFMLVNILFISAAVVFVAPYFSDIKSIVTAYMSGQVMLLPILPFVPFIFMGPSIAGLTYVLRNWARQEHAFWASDFFEHFRKNWKQGLLMSTISTVITYLFLTAVVFYLRTAMPKPFVLIMAGIVAALLLSVNLYTYPMMVTFDMKLSDILKNAWIFAVAKLPQNLFFLVIIYGLHAFLIWNVPMVWVALMSFFLIAWSGFTMNYYSWHVIDRYMMSQIPEEEQEESVFEDVL